MQENTTEPTTPEVITAETEAKEAPVSSPEKAPISSPRSGKKISKKALVIIVAVVAVILLGVGLFFVLRGNGETETENPVTSEESSKPSYTLERDPETGERELFGTDENKNNSGEAFLEYQEQIVEAEDSTNEEVFDAKIATASYDIATGNFSEAETILNGINRDELSADEVSRLDSMFGYLAEERANGE